MRNRTSGPELGVHLVGHRRALDAAEAVAAEELGLEREHEHPAHAELARGVDQHGHQPVARAVPGRLRMHGDRADLREVLPEHMERPAADDAAVAVLGDPELLYVLEERDGRLGEHAPLGDVGVDELADRGDVPGPRASDREVHPAVSLLIPRRGQWWPTRSGICE